MDKTLFVANWKSHKTTAETVAWFEVLNSRLAYVDLSQKEIIVCPSYLSLQKAFEIVQSKKIPVKLGVQDVSAFDEGAYTGEVAATQVKEFASYVIIGHSERRQHLSESNNLIAKKIEQAKKNNLKSILCIQGSDTELHEGIDVIAYEPIFAIGTGKVDTPENVSEVLGIIETKTATKKFLYGGSVNASNVKSFSNVKLVGGFLVGTASLDANSFLDLLI